MRKIWPVALIVAPSSRPVPNASISLNTLSNYRGRTRQSSIQVRLKTSLHCNERSSRMAISRDMKHHGIATLRLSFMGAEMSNRLPFELLTGADTGWTMSFLHTIQWALATACRVANRFLASELVFLDLSINHSITFQFGLMRAMGPIHSKGVIRYFSTVEALFQVTVSIRCTPWP